MRIGVAFSPRGVAALADAGRFGLMVVRGGPALSAARARGLTAVGTDELYDTVTAATIDRQALIVARRWRPGPLLESVPSIDIGIVAEYEMLIVVHRVLRLAAALDALDGPPSSCLVVAGSSGSAEGLVAQAVAVAKGWAVDFLADGAEQCPPFDILAYAGRPVPWARGIARYMRSRLALPSGGSGDRIAAYVGSEARPLLLSGVRSGAARLVLDPLEPPWFGEDRRVLRRRVAWAGGSPWRRPSPRAGHIPDPPELRWNQVDLSAAAAMSVHAIVGTQLGWWRAYASDLARAWRRAGIQGLVVSNDCTATGRLRALVAERIGIPSLVVQHGVLGWVGDRNHEVADYSTVWGPAVCADLAARGVAAERLFPIGWPVGSERMPDAVRARAAGHGDHGLILTTNLALATAMVPEDAVERQTLDAAAAVRAAGWSGSIVVKLHPSQDAGVFRAMFAGAGHGDVHVAPGSADPWPLMAASRFAVSASSSIACALPHLGCACLIHDRIRTPYAPLFARFKEFGVASAPEDLRESVAQALRGEWPAGHPGAVTRTSDYAAVREDCEAAFAQVLRQVVAAGPCSPGAAHRATAADTAKVVSFDHLLTRADGEAHPEAAGTAPARESPGEVERR